MVVTRHSLRRIRRSCGRKSSICQYSECSPADGHHALPLKRPSARPAAAPKKSTSIAALRSCVSQLSWIKYEVVHTSRLLQVVGHETMPCIDSCPAVTSAIGASRTWRDVRRESALALYHPIADARRECARTKSTVRTAGPSASRPILSRRPGAPRFASAPVWPRRSRPAARWLWAVRVR